MAKDYARKMAEREMGQGQVIPGVKRWQPEEGLDFTGDEGQTPMTLFKPEEEELLKRQLLTIDTQDPEQRKYLLMAQPDVLPAQDIGMDETASFWPAEMTGRYNIRGVRPSSMSEEDLKTLSGMLAPGAGKRYLDRLGGNIDARENERMQMLRQEALRKARGQ
jgi:hypothetical protein